MVGDGVGDVELRADRGSRLLFVIEIVGLEPEEPVVVDVVGAVEAVGERQTIDVPFAGMIRAIARGLEYLREKPGPRRAGSPLDSRQTVPTHLLGIIARQQGSPSGPATGGVVKLGEAQTVLGKHVQAGRLDFTAIASQVGITHVVRHNEKDVRRSSRDLQAWRDTETTDAQYKPES
jgi:hypothetical protein